MISLKKQENTYFMDNYKITPEMSSHIELDILNIIDRLNVFPTFKALIRCLKELYSFDEIMILMDEIEKYYDYWENALNA